MKAKVTASCPTEDVTMTEEGTTDYIFGLIEKDIPNALQVWGASLCT